MKSILFNAEMGGATFDRKKTQTRRVINHDWIQSEKLPISLQADNGLWHFWYSGEHKARYAIGDILWAREPAKITDYDGDKIAYLFHGEDESKIINIPNRFLQDIGFGEMSYPAWIVDCKGIPNGCIREMSRSFLHVTNVRVERLQDISNDDIYAEGLDWKDFECDNGQSKNDVFQWWQTLWNSTAKDGYKWEDNPYVFVYEFERIEKPC